MSRKVAKMVASLLPFPLLLLVTDSTGLSIPEKGGKLCHEENIGRGLQEALRVNHPLI